MKWPFRNDRADWVKVLEVMYDKQMTVEPEHFQDKYATPGRADRLRKEVTLAENIDYTQIDIDEQINYLIDKGIIDEVEIEAKQEDTLDIGDKPSIDLSQEGFRLAHEVKTERQRRNTNLILLALTAVLVVLTFGLLI